MTSLKRKILLSALFGGLLMACQKDNTSYAGYFYTLNSPDEARLFLFVDGQGKGELPYIKHYAGFSTDSIRIHSLKVPLAAGKHKLEAKDQNGQTRSWGSIRITKNKLSSSGGEGSQEISAQNNECLIGMWM